MKPNRASFWSLLAIFCVVFLTLGYSWTRSVGSMSLVVPCGMALWAVLAYGRHWWVYVFALALLLIGLLAVGVSRPVNTPDDRIASDAVQLTYLFDGLVHLKGQGQQGPPSLEEASKRIRGYRKPSGFGELDLSHEGVVMWLLKRTSQRFPSAFAADYVHFAGGIDACGLKGIILTTSPNRLYRNSINVITHDGVRKTLEVSQWSKDKDFVAALTLQADGR